MKRTISFVCGFTALGALIGAFMPLFLENRPAATYGLPPWVDEWNPAVALLVATIPLGLFFGALTGLASAFYSAPFARAWCLLAITVPAILAMVSLGPHQKKAEDDLPLRYALGAAVAIAMAVSLAYAGHRRRRRTAREEGSERLID